MQVLKESTRKLLQKMERRVHFAWNILITRCVRLFLSIMQFITAAQRITVGMKILGQIVSVEPLALIVSLPNQLMAHVPITNISSQLTHLLESMDDDEPMESPDDDETERHNRVPELFEIFHPGQYVRAVVSAVHAQGSTNIPGLPRERGEAQKASRRIELSLVPEKVNEGVVKSDVKPGVVSLSLTIILPWLIRF